MLKNILEYVPWLGAWPLRPFQEKLDSLVPDELEGTERYEFVLMRFRSLVWDLLIMYRMIGQVIRRLNRDFINLRNNDHTPKREPEDDLFYVLTLVNLDFTSFILLTRILMDKVARLLYNISKGDRPSIKRFVDWKRKISKDEVLVPTKLKELIVNTPWFDELKDVRDDYVVHDGYTALGVQNWDTLVLRSITDSTEIYYNHEKIQKLCDDILDFLKNLNNYLCDNFEILPVEITKT